MIADDAIWRSRLSNRQRGRVAMEMELVLRFNYGLVVPWVRRATMD